MLKPADEIRYFHQLKTLNKYYSITIWY